MPIPSATEILKLLKAGLTIEAQEKVIELREYAVALRDENLTLKDRVKALEAELQQKKNLKHERSLYWMEGDTVPFCPRCLENDGKTIHLFGPKSFHARQTVWECYTCRHSFSGYEGKAFTPDRPGYLR